MAKIAVIGLSGQSIFMKVNNLPTQCGCVPYCE